MTKTPVSERDLLVEAILAAEGGPSSEEERWQAEDMADDILATPTWDELRRVIRGER